MRHNNASNNRFAVYTVMVGDYDNIRQPLVVDDRFDYYLFTDIKQVDIVGVWHIRDIDYYNEDKTRMSRFPKMKPNIVLPDYDAWLYIDANLQVAEQRLYDTFVQLFNDGVEWGYVKHGSTDCAYEEAYWSIADGLESDHKMLDYCHFLRAEGFPKHYGLYFNNLIYRKHTDTVNKVDDLWWSLYERFTRRDQLSLPYAFWKTPGLHISLLLPENEHTFGATTAVIRHEHTDSAAEKGRRAIKQSFFEHARSRCRYINHIDPRGRNELFYTFHNWLYGLPSWLAHPLLDFCGGCVVLFYGPWVKLKALIRKKKRK